MRRGSVRVGPFASWIALVVLGALAALAPRADAQPADIAAIQAREARNADQRTLAALERFGAALIARYGGDPTLTMLGVSETEGEALAQRSPGAAPEHVIRQGERWIGTEGRQLRPWADAPVAAMHAFPLSSMRTAGIRAWLDAWRKLPGRATDFVTRYEAGYDPADGRVVVRAHVGSMTTGRLSLHAFDPATGAPIAREPPRR
ncbi:MAG: hypothetical protein ABI585_13720 [Betaproteobacteria bacterium]